MQCDRCAGQTFAKAGRDRLGRQLWGCQPCGRRLTARSTSAFSGYRFPDEVIALAVALVPAFPPQLRRCRGVAG